MRVEEKKTQNKQNQIYLHNNVEFSKKKATRLLQEDKHGFIYDYTIIESN